VTLPVNPPIKPMLARVGQRIPENQHYEPKWDGFRGIIFRDGNDVQITSRTTKPLERYFPELVAAATASLPQRCVIDGEIVVQDEGGALDFSALQQRIHPASSRIEKLARETPATFVAFDCLAVGKNSLMDARFSQRRETLADLLGSHREVHSPIVLTPATQDLDVAQEWFDEFEVLGIEGVVAKRLDLEYRPGERVMTKVKHIRTADCVVAGYRTYKNDDQAIGSLLLGLYTDDGELASVGITGSFSQQQRRDLFTELQPLVTDLDNHPWAPSTSNDTDARKPQDAAVSRWNSGKSLQFVPLRPEQVVEVKYDRIEDQRFRHTTQFLRWRHDRDPRSCTFDQLT